MRFEYRRWRMDPGMMLRITKGKGTRLVETGGGKRGAFALDTGAEVTGFGRWNHGFASATINVHLQPFRTELNIVERSATVTFFDNSALVQTSQIVRLHPRSYYRHLVERGKQPFKGRQARARAVEFANQFLARPQVVDGHAHPWARF
jgi:hypothetical protein